MLYRLTVTVVQETALTYECIGSDLGPVVEAAIEKACGATDHAGLRQTHRNPQPSRVIKVECVACDVPNVRGDLSDGCEK